MTIPDFETFYAGTSRRLLRYAYGLTGDLAEAHDLTQEAYARAWERWRRLRTYDNPEGWLRLVVTRLAADRRRWLSVRVRRGEPPPGIVAPPGEEHIMVVNALRGLPIDQRRALALHYLLDRPICMHGDGPGKLDGCSYNRQVFVCPTDTGIYIWRYVK